MCKNVHSYECNRKISIKNTIRSLVSLDGNIDVSAPVCVSKIEIAENIGTSTVEVHFMYFVDFQTSKGFDSMYRW